MITHTIGMVVNKKKGGVCQKSKMPSWYLRPKLSMKICCTFFTANSHFNRYFSLSSGQYIGTPQTVPVASLHATQFLCAWSTEQRFSRHLQQFPSSTKRPLVGHPANRKKPKLASCSNARRAYYGGNIAQMGMAWQLWLLPQGICIELWRLVVEGHKAKYDKEVNVRGLFHSSPEAWTIYILSWTLTLCIIIIGIFLQVW